MKTIVNIFILIQDQVDQYEGAHEKENLDVHSHQHYTNEPTFHSAYVAQSFNIQGVNSNGNFRNTNHNH